MTDRAQIVAEARRWVGTPYHHQARLRGVGVDCVGLIIGVGTELGILECNERTLRPWAGYARTPNPERMRAGLAAHLVQIGASEALVGDIAWMEWRDQMPMHLGIMGEEDGRLTLIHAAGDIGECVEHDIDDEWAGRIVGWWRYPGIE